MLFTMKEQNILQTILIHIGKIKGIRLFRNNTGMGWAGKVVTIPDSKDVLIKDARPLNAGLTEGSSDLIGWKTITITPEMVGKEIAVFVAIEVKTDTGRPTEKQMNFIDAIKKSGGYAGVARSIQDAANIVYHGNIPF